MLPRLPAHAEDRDRYGRERKHAPPALAASGRRRVYAEFAKGTKLHCSELLRFGYGRQATFTKTAIHLGIVTVYGAIDAGCVMDVKCESEAGVEATMAHSY